MSVPRTSLDQHLTHFRRRVLYDALLEATANYWERRADQLEWARPQQSDRAFQAPMTARRAAYDNLTAAATACRRHAHLLRENGLDEQARAEIATILAERDAGP